VLTNAFSLNSKVEECVRLACFKGRLNLQLRQYAK
jgi:hypothetical protein